MFLLLAISLSSFAQNQPLVNGEEYEAYAARWNSAMKDVESRLGLSHNDFIAFQNFYKLRNDSMQLEFHRKIKQGKITEGNIEGYVAFIESQEIFYYKQYEQAKKDYPSSISEFADGRQAKPFSVCNPGCTNIDFSNGTLSGWNAFYAINNSTPTRDSITNITGGPCGAVTGAANDPNSNLGFGGGPDYQVSIAKPGNDPLAGSISRVYPGGTSGFSVRLGDSTNANQGVAILSQTFMVSAANANLTYEYAIFLENPTGSHSLTEQPFFSVVLLNPAGDTISHCLVYNVISSNAGKNGFDSVEYAPNFDYVYYKDWVQIFADLQGYTGQCVTIQFIAADCALGGHFGYAYVEASCSSLNVINSSPVLCGNGITLSAPPGANGYLWSGPVGGIVGPNNTQSILADSAGTYSVIVEPVTGQACADTLFLSIKKSDKPPIRDSVVSQVNIRCFGEKNGVVVAGATGGTAPLTYLWNNGSTTLSDTGLVADTYTLTITDSNGCQNKLIDTIKQPPLLVGAIASAQPMCPGKTATLVGAAKGGTHPYTYTWDSTIINQSFTVSPLVTTTYTLVVTDSNGCKAVPVPVTVKINPKPEINFTADSVVGCYPMCVTFTDRSKVSPDSITKWDWAFGDGDSSILRKPDHCFKKTGNFTISLKVTSNNGCASDTTITKMITTYNHPNPAFIENPQTTIILEPNILYTDKSTDEYGIVSWLWEINNQGITYDTLQNPPMVTYKDTGVQCTKLIVINKHGCVDSVTECVDIQPVYALYVPNAFSPNGDGKNDVFLPQGIGICGFDMYIYDRWGSPIFHTTDLYQGWNGVATHGTGIAQEDTYIYLINTIDCVHHDTHRYVGNVTLIK